MAQEPKEDVGRPEFRGRTHPVQPDDEQDLGEHEVDEAELLPKSGAVRLDALLGAAELRCGRRLVVHGRENRRLRGRDVALAAPAALAPGAYASLAATATRAAGTAGTAGAAGTRNQRSS